MINGIMRKLTKSEEDWDVNLELKPVSEDVSEIPTESGVLLQTASNAPGFAPSNHGLTDYYKGVMLAALNNGGKYGDHRISVPWLRMTLAGLEGNFIEPEAMWYAGDQGLLEDSSAKMPTYDELFPSERNLAAELR